MTDDGITFERSKITTTGNNGDEKKYPNSHIGSFSKGLPHSVACGEVDTKAFGDFVTVLKTESNAAFDNLKTAGPRQFTNPQAGLATDLEGPAPKSLTIRSAPTVASQETAAEMVELYWMALLRDVPFLDWESGAPNLVADAAGEISKLEEFTGPRLATGDKKVVPHTLFRGVEKGCNVGPYLSQFLLRDIPYGSLNIVQRQRTVVPDRNYMTRWDEYLAIQNGTMRWSPDQFDATPRYIRNLRDLGQYVHVDELYEAYLNACLILLRDRTPFDPCNPYVGASDAKPQAKTQTGFGTWGGPHIVTLVTEVATRALKAVWWQKWFVHRRLRPERYGALVEKNVACKYNLPDQVVKSDAVRRVREIYGSNLLPMQFPEGSPTHPSYGAGHATVAGACVTLLKAWFDESAHLAQPPVVASADGTALLPYNGTDVGALTVGGELNKLAANIAIGRNGAGVHWRSDYYDSLRLGEQIAVALLVKQSGDYNEKFCLTFTSFDGRSVKITGGPDHQPGTAVFVDDGKPFLLPAAPQNERNSKRISRSPTLSLTASEGIGEEEAQLLTAAAAELQKVKGTVTGDSITGADMRVEKLSAHVSKDIAMGADGAGGRSGSVSVPKGEGYEVSFVVNAAPDTEWGFTVTVDGTEVRSRTGLTTNSAGVGQFSVTV